MPRTRKEITKEETNNCYGGAARRAGLNDLEEHNTCIRVSKKDVRKDEVRIDGRFVYNVKRKPPKAVRA